MAVNKKISQLAVLGQADSGDYFVIVDISDSDNKSITVSDLFASPQPIGSSNPSTGRFTTLRVSAGSIINEFSTDQTLSGNSNTALPTEKAVKTYVDTQINAIDIEALNFRNINNDSTASIGDVMLVDTTSGNINIILSGGDDGRIIVKKISSDSNIISVTTNTGGTIDATSQITIDWQYQAYTFTSDGTDFFIT